MRIPVLLLGLVLAMGALLAGVALWGAPAPQLAVHPEHPSMLRATEGAARAAPVFWPGALFGVLQIGFFGACFALGVRRREGLGPLARPVWIGLLLYAAVWAALLASYRRFLATADPGLVLSFPLPTAVMLYGLWPVPLWFLWVYLRHFEDWVLRAEDLERVRRVVREVEAEERGAGAGDR